MLTLNNKQFAETTAEHSPQCVGYVKRKRGEVMLYNNAHEKIGVINHHKCLCKATRTSEGYWYSFATIPEVGEYDRLMHYYDDMGRL